MGKVKKCWKAESHEMCYQPPDRAVYKNDYFWFNKQHRDIGDFGNQGLTWTERDRVVEICAELCQDEMGMGLFLGDEEQRCCRLWRVGISRLINSRGSNWGVAKLWEVGVAMFDD